MRKIDSNDLINYPLKEDIYLMEEDDGERVFYIQVIQIREQKFNFIVNRKIKNGALHLVEMPYNYLWDDQGQLFALSYSFYSDSIEKTMFKNYIDNYTLKEDLNWHDKWIDTPQRLVIFKKNKRYQIKECTLLSIMDMMKINAQGK